MRGWGSFYAIETGVLVIRAKISRTQKNKKNKTPLLGILAAEIE